MGSIVHDYKGNSEYASWMGLKELDQQILSELTSYFTSYAIYNNLSLSNNTSIEEYSRLSGLAREMET
ncbi:MAG: hypothetical protein IJ880_08800 [Bacilli bacterium]|nr:hypothetical protein [Bacilli bacterium]